MAAHHYVHVDVSSNYSSLNALLHKYRIWAYPSMYMLMSYQIILIMNDTLHTSQLYGCFPVFIYWCVFKTLILLNDFLHTSHWYGRSPSICWCLKITLLIKQLPTYNTGQWKFSNYAPIYVFKYPTVEQLNTHTSHLNGFSPFCMFWCLYRTLHDIMTSYAHHSEMNAPQHSDVFALHYVYLDTHFRNKSLITHVTGKLMLPAIYHFMFLQHTLITEWHITGITFIWTDPNMY